MSMEKREGQGQRAEQRDNKGGRPNSRPKFNRERKEEADDLQKKLVQVNRVTKVVKGGRTMRFTALVVVGDGKGKVGCGTGKAAEVPAAIEKATQQAKKNMINVPIVGTSIPHEVIGKFGRGNVLMKPAQEGTGIISGGSVRAVLEAAGYKDIRTNRKSPSVPSATGSTAPQGIF